MITIHGMSDSGNCYKPRLLMALLGRAFRHSEVSTIDGGTAAPAYRAKNPNGKVPLLELGDGRFLPESNAILFYLGEETDFVPADPFDRAAMLSWMFFEQYSHEPNVAVRRSLSVYEHMKAAATPQRLAETLDGGNRALAVMEERLSEHPFLVADKPTLSDIALFAYTHIAGEGGFDLSVFPGIVAWLSRIEALPGFRPMSWLPR